MYHDTKNTMQYVINRYKKDVCIYIYKKKSYLHSFDSGGPTYFPHANHKSCASSPKIDPHKGKTTYLNNRFQQIEFKQLKDEKAV